MPRPSRKCATEKAEAMRASIIIDNYNYGRFLRETIDSALAQTCSHLEVIVVDDGSTDDSRAIIASYGDRVIPVFKENGGQASAFNAGFAASQGGVVFFLDADDTLFPSAVENAVALFNEAAIVKVHWPLRVVDEHGAAQNRLMPPGKLPEGDFRETVLRGGPTSCRSSPTSGNAWSRTFLEKVMPMPKDVAYYKTCADEFLYTLAPVFGRVRALPYAQGTYRIHRDNIYAARPFAEKLRLELAGHDQQCTALSRVLKTAGFDVDVAAWKRNSWFHRLQQAAGEINALVPSTEKFILVDEGTWGAQEVFLGNRALPFLEHDGQFWGAPEDDAAAIAEVERQRRAGIGFLAFAWPAFWWLDHYVEFHRYLDAGFVCALKNDRLVIYDLKSACKTSAQATLDLWPFPAEAAFKPSPQPALVSVIINNYNYGRFLRESINSALTQTYQRVEVIVVDDGSTDDSREIIASYGDRVIPVFKQNGGQASAYNAGLPASRGEVVCFLDSDDTLFPNAAATMLKFFNAGGAVKVQWPMRIVDRNGKPTGVITTRQSPPAGDLRERVFRGGPIYDFNFHHGSAYARTFVEKLFPMPERPYRNGADVYLIVLAPLFGLLRTAAEPLGDYRAHGANNYCGRTLDDARLKEYIARIETNSAVLHQQLARLGVVANLDDWKRHNFNSVWPQRLLAARQDLTALIPAGGEFVLVNQNEWGDGEPVPGLRGIPFVERNGEYYGPPADDAEAIAELKRLRNAGASHVAFWWTAFWWLEDYAGFDRWLRDNFHCVLDNERLIVFDLRRSIK